MGRAFFVGEPQCQPGNYITQSDLEDAFGADNIAAWSNYDNDTTTANTSAITAAILKGEQWVLN